VSKLTNPGFVTQLLSSHGIRLRKKWGQNFLVDENILIKIVSAAEIECGDHVLEIGPGIGALTRELALRADRVTALEIDERLIPVLKETLAEYDNITIIRQDAMDVDYPGLLGDKPVKLVANMPYNVATPLFYRWLKQHRQQFPVMVCMLQKEVAQRIVAKPGSKEYGTLSVVCQFAAKTELLFTVPRTVFFPRPEISSAVVRLRPDAATQYDVGDEAVFFRVVEAVFSQRRKMALNTLHAVFPLSKGELTELGAEADLDLARRGETLSVAEFANLSRLLYNKTAV
jgi:16S rRNA (adenine1518-N6/adenine1519-N6)-dimethyltransferase